MAQLSPAAQRLRNVGIETLGVVATAAERARLYFRANPPRFPLGADPDLITHRAYGLGQMERNAEAAAMIESAAQRVARELGIPAKPGEGREAVDRSDGFHALPSDMADRQRHQIQMTGQFLVDRDGYIRWCRNEMAAGYALFPSPDELLSLSGHLPV